MKCVDCGNPCRNRCSRCKRPYCSYCFRKSGATTCLTYCRAPQATRNQQSKAARQTARQRAAAAQQSGAAVYTPPPALAQFTNVGKSVQGATPPLAQPMPAKRVPRMMLSLMSEAEIKAWKASTVAALEDAQARTTAYLARRATRGAQTSTDIAMQRDLVLYADLIEAMDETLALWERAQQGPQSGQGNTGIDVLPYDKLQP